MVLASLLCPWGALITQGWAYLLAGCTQSVPGDGLTVQCLPLWVPLAAEGDPRGDGFSQGISA